MWKQKIGISVGNYGAQNDERMAMLRRTGFDAVSLLWAPGVDLSDIVSAARKNDLEIQSIHAPFTNAAHLWCTDDTAGEIALKEQLCVLEDCRRFSIPIAVVHTWIGFSYQFDAAALSFRHFDTMVETAEQYGVRIAFENTEGEEFLFALMERYQGRQSVGFCWDSGHEQCYNHGQDLLAAYGDRLLVTHLNDNLGISRYDGETFWTDDLHLLPYDGIIDWDAAIRRLRAAAPLDILNFELNIGSKPNRHDNDIYGLMTLEQYYAEAYKRACRIAYRYQSAPKTDR